MISYLLQTILVLLYSLPVVALCFFLTSKGRESLEALIRKYLMAQSLFGVSVSIAAWIQLRNKPGKAEALFFPERAGDGTVLLGRSHSVLRSSCLYAG